MSHAGETFRGFPALLREVDVAGRTYRILGPANFNELIDSPETAARFARDEYLPYWAEFWPAATLLAERVAQWPPAGDPPARVLELGCGLGLVGLVALARGYDVTMSDYDDDALAFVVESARRSGLPEPPTRRIDWRQRYPELRPQTIVAAEILYERRSIAPIAAFLATHLPPGGTALICDAERPPADEFPAAAATLGLHVNVEMLERPRTPRLDIAAAHADRPDARRTIRAALFRVRRPTDPRK